MTSRFLWLTWCHRGRGFEIQCVSTANFKFNLDIGVKKHALSLRFCEWTQAVWEFQREHLLGEDRAWNVRGMAIYLEDDANLDAHKSLLTGRAMSQWWDRCDDAGPPARTVERFAEDLPCLECLATSDGEVKIFIGNFSKCFGVPN